MTENVIFGHTCLSPQRIPQARHIESVWGVLGQKVYANDWAAKKYKQLVAYIQSKLKYFEEHYLQTPMTTNLKSNTAKEIVLVLLANCFP